MLVEDHASFRQTLALMFDRETEFEVAAQAGSLGEARQVAVEFGDAMDLGVIDLTLPDGEGIELIQEIREVSPHFSALILTASLDQADHARAIEAGAAGVLHKSADVDEIVGAVRTLAEGKTLISPEEIVTLLRLAGSNREQEREARAGIERLTPRELQVLQALAEGLSNKEIAERLHVSVDTERTHMMNILTKLGVHSRLQALLFAVKYDIVELT
ncbi:MAG TPA: response regulator transcription factor [Rubrobacteraceae bacterium]|nr:response regulator transcription factor [Rubrobacteraceae bacterium]